VRGTGQGAKATMAERTANPGEARPVGARPANYEFGNYKLRILQVASKVKTIDHKQVTIDQNQATRNQQSLFFLHLRQIENDLNEVNRYAYTFVFGAIR
jgi:hypothetical protein